MNNVVWQGVVQKRRDADGPDMVVVTKESNGCAVWFCTHEDGAQLLDYKRLCPEFVAVEQGVVECLSRRRSQLPGVRP